MKTFNIQANQKDPQIIFVTDAPADWVHEAGATLSRPQMELVKDMCRECDIAKHEVAFINACPPVPEHVADSEKRLGEWLAPFEAPFAGKLAALSSKAKIIVPMGKLALRQCRGKNVQITKERGKITSARNAGNVPVLPIMSPAYVLRKPEAKDIWQSDFRQLRVLKESGWDMTALEQAIESADYQWTLDLQELIDNPPACLALDTETKGFEWKHGRRILCVQLTVRPGHAYVVPLDIDYFNNDTLRGESSRHLPKITGRTLAKLIKQLRQILGNPDTKVCGANLKFDLHHLRNYDIEVANFYADTTQLAFLMDDNMQSKALEDCVRRWVPELSGYSDLFDKDPVHQGKSRMDLVPHDQMIRYGGGDTDACYRLARVLIRDAMKDSRQWETFKKIQMPGIRTFFESERKGINIDKTALRALGVSLAADEQEAYQSLIRQAAAKAPAVLRRHEEAGLSFSRDRFTADLLFSRDGFNLKPLVFTDSTRNLPAAERIPSVSTKTHLPFFNHLPFIRELIEYQQLVKMRTTYVGEEASEEFRYLKRTIKGRVNAAVIKAFEAAGQAPPEDIKPPVRKRRIMMIPAPSPEHGPVGGIVRSVPTATGRIVVDAHGNCYRGVTTEASGFWQHLEGTCVIHPSFFLSGTVTGRSSCRNPSLQNLPKRGKRAAAFRHCFVARPGYKLVEVDLSQAELRIAAWMANERVMLKVYREGGDIHALTAARTLGVSMKEFKELPKAEQKAARQKAKAVNFGFLYGMWWKKFKDFAKTDYDVTYTDAEAEHARELFFQTFPALPRWHDNMKAMVNHRGFVRALHGAKRRLPDIHSDDKGIRQEAERQAVNSPVQRFASDIGIMAMARFGRDCNWDDMFPVAFIHDALVVEVREEIAEQAAQAVKFYMETTPFEEWFGIKAPLPIVADISIGTSLGDMEERPDLPALRPDWYQEELDMAGIVTAPQVVNY